MIVKLAQNRSSNGIQSPIQEKSFSGILESVVGANSDNSNSKLVVPTQVVPNSFPEKAESIEDEIESLMDPDEIPEGTGVDVRHLENDS